MTTFWQFLKMRSKPDPNSRFAKEFRAPSKFSSDFVYDAVGDVCFPRGPNGIKTFAELHRYLRNQHHVCDRAIEGALDTWADWVLWQIQEGEYGGDDE